MKAFQCLEDKLVAAPIMIALDWSKPFEVVCDASGVVLRTIFGQNKEKFFQPTYYERKELNEAKKNYTITEQELFVIVNAFEKLRACLLGAKVVVHTNYSALRYLLAKKEAKP